MKVRLQVIDAPEKGQPFGQASRQHLARLCFQEPASITVKERDRYGRSVARVSCRGQDASAEQVRAGMAWAFMKYLTDPEIARLEEVARAAGVGLWRDPAPVARWEWRATAGAKQDAQRGLP